MDEGLKAFTTAELSRRRLLRIAGSGILATAMAGLLAACGDDDEDEPAGETEATTAPGASGTTAAGTTPEAEAEPTEAEEEEGDAQTGGTLTIGRPSDAVSLDPHAESTSPGNWVMSNIYETLVVLNQDSEFEPGLAETWESVEESVWEFKLRQGVKFHDGTDFTAEAVKFSIDRIKDPENPGRSASNLLAITEVRPVDDVTVQVVTDGPYGPLLNIISLIYATGVVSPAAVEEHGEDFGRNPVGTGPFKFVEWRSNDLITIERNDDYWGEKALLDQAVYRVIPEESARMLAVETGEIDMVMFPAPSQLETFKSDDNFTVVQTEGVRVFYFGFNVSRPIVSDVKVRQAINHAVNRQEFVDNILEGAAALPTSYISPAIFGYKDVSSAWEYDLDKAKALLDEAGWVESADGVREKDGQKLELRHLAPRGRYLKDAECAEAFQAAMREIGVQINLEILEWATLFEQSRQPTIDADLLTFGWSTATGDADYSLYPLFGSQNTPPGGWNSHQYSNPEFDDLAIQAQQSTDPDERQELYGQMLDILAEDAIWVPIYNSIESVITGKHVKDFTIHPIDYYLWLDTVWLDRS